MLSLKQLKEIEVVPVVIDTDMMPIMDAVNDEDEEIIVVVPSVIDPDFDRLNRYWQDFYKQRGETYYEQMMREWKENQLSRVK